MSNLSKSLFLCLALFASGTDAASFGNFTAEYRVRMGNVTVGKATFSLAITPDQRYLYQSHAEPTGFAAFFVSDQADEISSGTIVNNNLKPLRYKYGGKLKNKSKYVDLKFDWPHNAVIDNATGKTWAIPLKPEAIDRHALQVMLMRDLATDKNMFSYLVVENGKIKPWNFVIKARDKINTPAGKFDAVILKRTNGSKRRSTELWCAPALGNLPVMIEQFKDGSREFYMELTKVTGRPIVTTPNNP